ncbi:MAG: sugar transferase, partial [Kiritimatiellae bacterium]|nr:sugar transferase [Kiritimatiellia bacterium]
MYKHFFKRVLDILCAGLALLCLSPLLLLLTVLGAVFMRGNPFFVYPRAGKNGRIFNLVKFRSMAELKDANGDYLPDAVRGIEV